MKAPPASQQARIAMRAARPLAAAALSLAFLSPASAGWVGTVVGSGLDNPRDLAFGPDGALYVAEAGVPTGNGPSTVIRGDPNVYTETGSVTRIQGGTQSRVLTGLPAIYNRVTGETQGPNGIAFDAAGRGHLAIGLGADPGVRSTDLAPAGTGLARIVQFDSGGAGGGAGGGGAPMPVADPGAFESARNPDGGLPDSNPWHLAPAPGGGLLLTDAGANALLGMAPGGELSLLATFPARDLGGPGPMQAVPTGVAVGPDGAIYVAQLTGFPFPPGGAEIFRIGPGGPEAIAGGFTNVTDIAVGPDGSLYVLEFDSDGLLNPGTAGALIRLRPDGRRETLLGEGLIAATGLAIGPDGALYVTNLGVAAGAGQVLRIAEVPTPAPLALTLAALGGLAVARRRRHGGRAA